MHQRLISGFLVVSCIVGVSCGANPATLPSATPAASTAQPRQTPITPAAIVYPTRVPAPVATTAPALFASYISVEMKSFIFSPATLKGRVGQPISLDLRNNDVLRHNFAIDDSDIEVVVLPGFSQKVSFVFSKPGNFTFVCNIVDEGDHRSAGMMGTIVIDPAP